MNGFIANLYELFGLANQGNFSNDMYNNGFYSPLLLFMIISVIVISIVYYYVINHPRLNRWWCWLLFNVGTAVLNFVFMWVYAADSMVAYYAMQQMESPYNWINYFYLSVVSFSWTVVFFFLFSFIIKWGSRNCKHSPFL